MTGAKTKCGFLACGTLFLAAAFAQSTRAVENPDTFPTRGVKNKKDNPRMA
jgi:hypothetical protein